MQNAPVRNPQFLLHKAAWPCIAIIWLAYLIFNEPSFGHAPYYARPLHPVLSGLFSVWAGYALVFMVILIAHNMAMLREKLAFTWPKAASSFGAMLVTPVFFWGLLPLVPAMLLWAPAMGAPLDIQLVVVALPISLVIWALWYGVFSLIGPVAKPFSVKRLPACLLIFGGVASGVALSLNEPYF